MGFLCVSFGIPSLYFYSFLPVMVVDLSEFSTMWGKLRTMCSWVFFSSEFVLTICWDFGVVSHYLGTFIFAFDIGH